MNQKNISIFQKQQKRNQTPPAICALLTLPLVDKALHQDKMQGTNLEKSM
jgi:hypothetical protein